MKSFCVLTTAMAMLSIAYPNLSHASSTPKCYISGTYIKNVKLKVGPVAEKEFPQLNDRNTAIALLGVVGQGDDGTVLWEVEVGNLGTNKDLALYLVETDPKCSVTSVDRYDHWNK